MFYIRSKNIFLHQNYLGALKLSKQKKFWKFSKFFFWTVYRVRGAMVGGNFSPIGEYSSTVKNQQKWASVHRRVGLKGLNIPVKGGKDMFILWIIQLMIIQNYIILLFCRYRLMSTSNSNQIGFFFMNQGPGNGLDLRCARRSKNLVIKSLLAGSAVFLSHTKC
jgi:hypothetical protein